MIDPDTIETHWNIRRLDNGVRVTLTESRSNSMFYVSIDRLIDNEWEYTAGSATGHGKRIDAMARVEKLYEETR